MENLTDPVPIYKRKGIGFLLFLVIFCLVTAAHMIPFLKQGDNAKEKLILKDFSSDMVARKSSRDLFNRDFARKERFVAFAKYTTLEAGIYRLEFSLSSPAGGGGEYQFQVAKDRGRTIHSQKDVQIHRFPGRISLQLVLRQRAEIEPRILFVSGNNQIKLQHVEIRLLNTLIPWKKIFFRSYIWAIFLYMLVWVFYLSLTNNERWKIVLALIICCLGAVLIIRNAWVSEDAYITLRHVDNFLAGQGPVFNPGERVEGFTHVLWFVIVTIFRALGFSANGALLLPGFIFSFAALYLIFFKTRFRQKDTSTVQLHPAGAILLGMGAFLDFATSGLETSLSYFLLALYALFVASGYFMKRPLLMGLVTALLTLNRPDFGIFLLLLLLLYLGLAIRKQVRWSALWRFLIFPAGLLGCYEIFRMGYYGAIFPNPYYAKSGAGSHFLQGWQYLWDFCQGSLLPGVLVVTGIALYLMWRQRDDSKNRRLLVLCSGLLHGFFVIRGGGDFMHGRFLLPAVVLISMASIGSFDRLLGKNKWHKVVAVVVILCLFFTSLLVVPVQKRGNDPFKVNHGITDERNFYYNGRLLPLDQLFKDHMIIMWKTIAQNYKQLALKTRTRIRVAFATVGFLGFFSGKYVYIVDRLGLADPVISRIDITKRGRPGHEKHAPFGYLMMQRLTFADTPFPLWNQVAKTRYGVIWDLSPRTLNRFSSFVDQTFKQQLDAEIIGFLKTINDRTLEEQADFLYFLKTFWYKHAPAAARQLFDTLYQQPLITANSTAYKWIKDNGAQVTELQQRIQGPLTFGRFWSNVIFALTRSPAIHFGQ